MNKIRKYIDQIKPNFEKGGKFEKLHSTFDAFETFLFVPNEVTSKGSHIRDFIDMKRTMILVVVSLIPALLFGIWNAGYFHYMAMGEIYGETVNFWDTILIGLQKVLPVVVVSYVTGLSIDFAFAQIRGHEVNEGFLVSGLLIPLVMPVEVPLWMVALATAFAVIIGKEIFGGTGMNIWNPALTARAFLFFAYPAFMSGDKVWISGMLDGKNVADGFSGATALAQAADGNPDLVNGIGEPISIADMFFGFIPGSIGETSVVAILLGALLLLITGIGSWRIMLSALAGGLAMGFILNAFAVNELMAIPAWEHILLGGFMFGIVFMATDPVSAAQTTKGKWIYGFLVGFLAILIRVLNPAYPEGVMLSILLLNTFAPLIDHYVVHGSINKRLKRVKVLSHEN